MASDASGRAAARPVRLVAEGFALAGGMILCALALMSCISIAGRALVPLGLRPVPGDFELIQLGAAIAVACFLPICQLEGGHAAVDFLARRFVRPVRYVLDLAVALGFAAVACLLIWRLGVGLFDKLGSRETTYILQFPVWWFYAGVMIPGLAWAGISLLGVALALTGKPLERGAEPVGP